MKTATGKSHGFIRTTESVRFVTTLSPEYVDATFTDPMSERDPLDRLQPLPLATVLANLDALKAEAVASDDAALLDAVNSFDLFGDYLVPSRLCR